MRKWMILLAVIAVAVVLGTLGYVYSEASKIRVEFVGLDLDPVSLKSSAVLRISNPSSLTLDLRDLYVAIYVDGEPLLEAYRHAIYVPPHSSVDVRLSLSFSTRAALDVLKKLVLGGVIRYRALVSCDIPIKLGPLTLFSYSYRAEARETYIVGKVSGGEAQKLGFKLVWLDKAGREISYAYVGQVVKACVSIPANGTAAIEIRADLAFLPDRTLARFVESLPIEKCYTIEIKPMPNLRSIYVVVKIGTAEIELSPRLPIYK